MKSLMEWTALAVSELFLQGSVKECEDLLQIFHTHLTRSGCLCGCAECQSGSEYFTAQTADDAGARHRHGDDWTVCVNR